MGISTSGGGRKVGEIFDHSGTIAPPGAMALPTAQTNANRTAYAKLFLAIGITWGAGDGVSTFGLPWMKPDHAAVQANGNVGTETTGVQISHTHGASQAAHGHSIGLTSGGTNYGQSTISGLLSPDMIYENANTGTAQPAITVNAAGGTHNLAAGVRLLKCIQYL